MFGPRQHLRELHKELKDVLSGTLTDDAVEKEKEIQIKIKTLLEQDEIYWVQRGRANWLRQVDQNTSFSMVLHRQEKENLCKEAGDRVDEQEQLDDLASSFTFLLFTHLVSKFLILTCCEKLCST
jgi:hypothetical protein